MASGHINRANRPNTWLHRPAANVKKSLANSGAVHTWHKADIPRCLLFVRFRGGADRHRGVASPASAVDDPYSDISAFLLRCTSRTLRTCCKPRSLGLGVNPHEAPRVHHALSETKH